MDIIIKEKDKAEQTLATTKKRREEVEKDWKANKDTATFLNLLNAAVENWEGGQDC